MFECMYVPIHRFQWEEQDDGATPNQIELEEQDCLFFDRATNQYLTSGDPSSPQIKNMREALQVKTKSVRNRARPRWEATAVAPSLPLFFVSVLSGRYCGQWFLALLWPWCDVISTCFPPFAMCSST